RFHDVGAAAYAAVEEYLNTSFGCGDGFGKNLDRRQRIVEMAAAMVRDDHRVDSGIHAGLDVLAGHDSLGDDGNIRRRLDPVEIFPGRRGVRAFARARAGPRRASGAAGRRVIDAAGSRVIVSNVWLPPPPPLGGECPAHRPVTRAPRPPRA